MPTAILEVVLGNLVVATALAVIALVVSRWTSRPALAHALWLLVLVKLLTPSPITIPIRCLPAHEEFRESTPTLVPHSPPIAANSSPIVLVEPERQSAIASTPSVPAPVMSTVSTTESNLPPAAPSSLVAAPTETRGAILSWKVGLLAVWGTGSLISLFLAARRVRQFSRLLSFASPASSEFLEEVTLAAARMGLRRVPRVRIVPGGIAPLLWAIGRPTLYFPSGLLNRLSAEQRLALITHELAHLRRRDHVVRLIELTVLAIYWWCPLAWLARREMRRLEEEACDAEVVGFAPEAGFAYASALLETIDYLAGVVHTPAIASGIGDADSLKRRFILILNATPNLQAARHARRAVVIAGLMLLLIGPKFDRLTAAIPNEVVESTESIPAHPLTRALPLDEGFTEPVQFLPTPVQFIDPRGLGTSSSLASALSPDGSRLAVAVGSRVGVWDLASKHLLFTLSGHTETINAIAFSPNGAHIATAGNDTVAVIWDAATGQRLHMLTGHGRWVFSAAFSPDGQTLVTGGYDKTVRLWNVTTGTLEATWLGHTGGVRSVGFSPDGQTVVTGSADCTVRLWDRARGVVKRTLRGHDSAVRVVVFSPDGIQLASTSEDRSVRIWDAVSGHEIGSPVPLPDYGTALAYSRHGQALFAGTLNGYLLHINATNGQIRGYVGVEPGRSVNRPAHTDAVTAILSPPDGKLLYTISQDRVALAWPAAGPLQTTQLIFQSQRPLTAVALSPDGRVLATGGQDGMIHLWDAITARELKTLPGHLGGVTTLMFGATGRLVSAGADERVRVWDTTSGRTTHTVIQATADLRIAISPDGRILAIGGRKIPGVRLLNLVAGGKARSLGESAGEITALAFTPTGDRIATGYASGMVRFWDSTTGEEIVHGSAGAGCVDSISLAPTHLSAEHIAAIVLNATPWTDGETEMSPVHEVVFLDTRDGSILEDSRPLAHPSPVTAAAFTADGSVLTAACDGNLYLWNLRTGRVTRTIRGHTDAVRGVALTTDGTAVFSAGDRSAKMWPLKNEEKKSATDQRR